MEIIDLTHTIHNTMPVYPGTASPELSVEYSVEKDGFHEHRLIMLSHTGTHIDAPAHFIKDGKTLDNYHVSQFFGKALIIDVSKKEKFITAEDLESYREKLQAVDFLIISTGWNQFWGEDKYFSGYQSLTPEAAIWLTKHDLKGVGFDTISADASDTKDFPVHKILFQKEMIIIENLANLDKVKQETFLFSCLPLNFTRADGSPVRAVAMSLK